MISPESSRQGGFELDHPRRFEIGQTLAQRDTGSFARSLRRICR
jgi:hypothetical protein